MPNRAGANRSTEGSAMAAATTTVLTSHHDTPNAMAISDAARPEVNRPWFDAAIFFEKDSEYAQEFSP